MKGEEAFENYGGIDQEYRECLEKYFNESPGPSAWKLQNFAKYVPRQSLTRLLTKNELFQKILNIHGSIVECGVFAGGSLMMWAQLSSIFEPLNTTRKIIGFDTFSGFPDIHEKDKKRVQDNPYLCKNSFSGLGIYDDLQGAIDLHNKNRIFKFPENKIFLVKGDICETTPVYVEDNPETIVALLYLDADLYEPTKAAIENFLPRMPEGGIIVFDELNCDAYPGETVAVLETMGVNNFTIRRFAYDTHVSYVVLGE